MTRSKASGLNLVRRQERAEAVWWWRLRLEDSRHDRERLFGAHAAFARQIAARHGWRTRHTAAASDAVHWAYEGLLHAIDHFDLLRGVGFRRFARPRIDGCVSDGLARMSDLNAQHHAHRRIERERLRSLSDENARPIDDPLALVSRLASGLAVGMMLEGTRILMKDDDPDPAPDAYQSLAWRQLQHRLGEQLGRLPERERQVMRYHYLEGMSFAQVADLLGLTRGRISQLHRAAVERLRKRLVMEE